MGNDYGYFGKGSTGYAHYMTAYKRNFGSGGGRGGNSGCLVVLIAVAVIVVVWLIVNYITG